MPSIRSLSSATDVLTFVDHRGAQRQLLASAIPGSRNTVPLVEAWINGTGLPALLDGSYQMRVHVFSRAPLRIAVITANNDVIIPADWWVL